MSSKLQDLTNKVALVTGASKGIGLAIAKSMIDQGMKVIITSRKQGDLDQIASSLPYDSLLALQCDVRSYASQVDVVERGIHRFGSLDVVVANAGVGVFKPVDELTLQDWADTIDINLTGAFYTLKATADALKKSQGYYISIASLAGANFFEKGAAYNASKFGLVGFTQAAMLDLRKYKIKTSTIMPGSVATEFNNHVISEKDAWKIQSEDIAQLVINLLQMNPRTLPSKVEVRPSFPA